MSPLYIAIVVILSFVLGVLLTAFGLYVLSRSLENREPYASFMHLPTRRKLAFFRRLAADPRVPRRVKVLPLFLAVYLAFPIDIIPDFIPVLGYVDDVAIVLGVLALMIRLTPGAVIDDLLRQLAQPEPN